MGIMGTVAIIRAAITALEKNEDANARTKIEYPTGTLVLFKEGGVVKSLFLPRPKGAT